MEIDWDGWRLDYPEMTFEDQVTFYKRVAELHPTQEHWDDGLVRMFLETSRAKRVDEIGGWDGKLAREILSKYHRQLTWTNHDLVELPQPDVPGYSFKLLETWPWEATFEGDALVLSHVIEHLSADHLELLANHVRHKWVFQDSPLPESTPRWQGYVGSHVLPLSAGEVDAVWSRAGYVIWWGGTSKYGVARYYLRKEEVD
jgi:hypothetical protein